MTANVGQANPPHCHTCWTIGSNSATCYANADDYPCDLWDIQSDNFYIEPQGDLHIGFWATVATTGPGYDAYATANWSTTGPTHYYSYGVYSSNSPYVSDYYGYLYPGNLNLAAYAFGAGSSSGLTADW